MATPGQNTYTCSGEVGLLMHSTLESYMYKNHYTQIMYAREYTVDYFITRVLKGESVWVVN